ncbi:GIY-YIG nuclease family protein [Sphingosinithalassobacter portus]|uniref:GIY-YIG nuclease family protein n=1 Tax=Stakelama portus TaxID=2676234 RepID=UPI000D6E0ED3|nr:GIY-YIG nuclease family protein [Sphingosinithalassobacter portus]
MFWAYILRCKDGSYYTGHSDDLDTRIAQHQSGAIPGHTRSRRPVTLVWSESFQTRIEALETEKRIKGWSRAKKEALIGGDWERLKSLAKSRDKTEPPSTSSG